MTTHSRKVNPDERIDLIADYETYYDKDYSLRKLSPAEYILDPRFQIHGAGVTVGDLPITWVDGHALPEFFASVPWERTRFITHNALFDACILAWRFNVRPAQYCCTMSMAAARLRHITGKVSLDAIAKHLGEPPKLHTVQKLQGKTTEMIRADAALYNEMVEYGIDDTFKCRRIYNWMLRENAFPEAQLRIIDMIVRMAVEPQFVGNTQLLWEHLQQVMADKAALVQATGLDGRDSLMSDPKLAELLMALNVSPPVKKSKATGKPIWAFAKTDPEFNELLTNDDPRVQALAAARLGVKTTIEETRTQRFINIANLYWRDQTPQSIPIPLRYSGAHTHRFSGDWQMNAQNLGRQSKLRKALCAPDGRIVAAADSVAGGGARRGYAGGATGPDRPVRFGRATCTASSRRRSMAAPSPKRTRRNGKSARWESSRWAMARARPRYSACCAATASTCTSTAASASSTSTGRKPTRRSRNSGGTRRT